MMIKFITNKLGNVLFSVLDCVESTFFRFVRRILGKIVTAFAQALSSQPRLGVESVGCFKYPASCQFIQAPCSYDMIMTLRHACEGG